MIKVFCDACREHIDGEAKVMQVGVSVNGQPVLGLTTCEKCAERVKPTVDHFLQTLKTVVEKTVVVLRP